MPPAGTTARDGSRMNERINAIAVREKYYVFCYVRKNEPRHKFVNDQE